tara:strand:- start:112 stop:369 length:258 start_codon:yes stop_codon:yes gene_type:complete
MANTYDLQIKFIERNEKREITAVQYKYIAYNEKNQMAFIKKSQAVSKKDKVEDSTVEEWLLKKIKTKGQKELKELLGQKTCDFTV